MARPVEHDDTKFLDWLLESLGEFGQVVADRGVNVDSSATSWTNGNLVHVKTGSGIEHRTFIGERDDRKCAVATHGGQGCSIDGVDGNVDLRRATVANLLTVVEHGRFVLFTLTNDYYALHLDAAEDYSHGVYRSAVGSVLITAASPASSGDGGRFGNAN